MGHVKNKFEFIAATCALLMAFAASAAPIPLYDLYHRVHGVSYNALALTSVVYFVGAVTALLVFGRISNHLGRKPVAFIVFGLAALSCVLFLNIDSALPLVAGRFLLGLACGLASSGIAAYVADTAPDQPEWLPATIISNAPMVGLTIGALISGAIVAYIPDAGALSYVVAIGGLFICAMMIALGEETVPRKAGLLKSLKPALLLPQADKRLYPVAAATFVATWATGGFYQAYGPSIAAEQLGTLNTLMAAVIFSSYLIPGAIGGPLAARLTPSQAQRAGMLIFALSMAGLIISMKISSLYGFLACSVMAGAAQGAVLTGSVRSLMADVRKDERAGVLSLIFATSYTGAAIPSFIAGRLSSYLDLFQLMVCYGVLAVIVCMVTLVFARDPQRIPAGNPVTQA